jgi:hypothetical protein
VTKGYATHLRAAAFDPQTLCGLNVRDVQLDGVRPTCKRCVAIQLKAQKKVRR